MRTVWGLLVGASLAAGCIQPETPICNGQICPVDTVCDAFASKCVSPSQISACEGLAEGATCSYFGVDDTGACDHAVCYEARCGDGFITAPEVCDDKNDADGDGCSAQCQSNETCGNGIVDVAVDESCDQFMNFTSGDGCSSACTAEVSSWHEVDLDNFVGVQGAEMAYDAARRRTVMFGGLSPTLQATDGTLELDGFQWEQLVRGIRPPGRDGHVLAYVPGAGGVVLFGGSSNGMLAPVPRDDTWMYDGQWHELMPAQRPSPRTGAAGAYDAARAELVVFGGQTAQGVLDETWVFAGGTWTQRLVAGPPARRDHRMTYDSLRQRVVMFGGTANDTATWEWDGVAWTAKTIAPPEARGGIAFDPVRGVVVMFAGMSSRNNSTEVYDGTSWTPVEGARPYGGTDLQGRRRPAMTFDGALGGVLMRGGTDRVVGAPGPGFDDTWVLTTTWSEHAASQPLMPQRRGGAGLAYDAKSARFLFASGWWPDFGPATDTWTYDGAQWVRRVTETPGFLVCSSQPTPCTARATEDLAHDRVVLVRTNGSAMETYAWTGTDWQLVATTGAPPPRKDFGLTFDAARGVVVLFGGERVVGVMPMGPLNDTWILDGATWRQVTALGPSPRSEPSIAYDAGRGQVVLFGGRGGPMMALDDTWTFDGTTWVEILDAGARRPSPRRDGAMTFHGIRGRLILFGGESQLGPFSDTWELADDKWVELAAFEGPGPRKSPHMSYDPDRKLILLHGGDPRTDTWELVYRSSLADEVCDGGMDEDTDGLVDCLDDDCAQSLCNRGTGLCRDHVCAPL